MDIKKYYNNLLCKHLSIREFNSIDFTNMSYYNNKNLTIRAVGCPNRYKEGGTVYIFKSDKKDVENYTLVKEIKSLDVGKFGYSIDMLLDSRLKYKNILAVSSVSDSENRLRTYIYSNIFGVTPKLVIINNEKTIKLVTHIKLSLSKRALNRESILILMKGGSTRNTLINKHWEMYNLIIEKDYIAYKPKE